MKSEIPDLIRVLEESLHLHKTLELLLCGTIKTKLVRGMINLMWLNLLKFEHRWLMCQKLKSVVA